MEVLAKVEENKVKWILNKLEERGIARQANFTEKFTAKTAELNQRVNIRAVESESLKVGKSLKIGKNRIKSEKSDLISY